MKVLGYERNDGVNKQTNNPYYGYSVYVGDSINPQKGAGIKSFKKIYIPGQHLSAICPTPLEKLLDKKISVMYDQFQNVALITLVE